MERLVKGMYNDFPSEYVKQDAIRLVSCMLLSVNGRVAHVLLFDAVCREYYESNRREEGKNGGHKTQTLDNRPSFIQHMYVWVWPACLYLLEYAERTGVLRRPAQKFFWIHCVCVSVLLSAPGGVNRSIVRLASRSHILCA